MKKLIITAIASLVMLPLIASRHAGYSEFVLNLPYSSEYIVVFNQREFQSDGNRFSLTRLEPGTYEIKLIRKQRSYKHRYSRGVEVYRGHVRIPARSKVLASYNNFNFRVESVVPLCNVNRYTVRSIESPNYYSNREFEGLVQYISRLRFNDEKLEAALMAVNNNNISSNQVKEIMCLLTFDNDRLRFAKEAYDNTYDKYNYYTVVDALDFDSNRRDLVRYINNR